MPGFIFKPLEDFITERRLHAPPIEVNPEPRSRGNRSESDEDKPSNFRALTCFNMFYCKRGLKVASIGMCRPYIGMNSSSDVVSFIMFHRFGLEFNGRSSISGLLHGVVYHGHQGGR